MEIYIYVYSLGRNLLAPDFIVKTKFRLIDVVYVQKTQFSNAFPSA